MDPIPEDDLQVPDRTTDLCQPGDRSQLEAEAPVARGSPSVPRERSKRASKPATAFSFDSKKEVVHLRGPPSFLGRPGVSQYLQQKRLTSVNLNRTSILALLLYSPQQYR